MSSDNLFNLFNQQRDTISDFFSGTSSSSSRSNPSRPPNTATANEIKMRGIEKTLCKEVENGDTAFLRRAIQDYKKEVFQHGTASIVQAYAVACLFIGDLEEAVQAYSNITVLTSEEKAVLGLIDYHKGKYKEALTRFKTIEDHILEVRLAQSAIEMQQGQTHHSVHREILEPFLAKSFLANMFLGVVYFNEGIFREAEHYFMDASKIDHDSYHARLYTLIAIYAQGNFVEKGLGKFYHETRCSFSPEQMQEYLQQRQLQFPMIRVNPKNLFKIVKPKK